MSSEGEHAAEKCQQFYLAWAATYRTQLRPSVLHILFNEADAEDVLTQTLVKFVRFRNRKRWENEIENIPAYLNKIARRLSFRLVLKRSRETSLDGDDEQSERNHKAIEEKAMRENDPTSRYHEEIARDEFFKKLPRAIMSDLTDEEKKIGRCYYDENLNAEEISRVLGKDVYYIRHKLNNLRMKITYRVRKLCK